jgi:hypothetical protein
MLDVMLDVMFACALSTVRLRPSLLNPCVVLYLHGPHVTLRALSNLVEAP